ncbi:MAG: hypothetical protein WEB58_07440 [Planctomycetaceae bacterium]
MLLLEAIIDFGIAVIGGVVTWLIITAADSAKKKLVVFANSAGKHLAVRQLPWGNQFSCRDELCVRRSLR